MDNGASGKIQCWNFSSPAQLKNPPVPHIMWHNGK